MRKLIIFVIGIVIVLGSLGIWQKENIKIILDTQKFNQEELETAYTNEKEKLKNFLELEMDNPIRDFTEEEIKLINLGKLDTTTALENIKKETKSKEKITKTKSIQKEEIVNNSLGELYSLKAVMIGELENVLGQAKAEYMALSPEQRGTRAKAALAQKYISKGLSLEGNADAKVENILSNLDSQLKSIGETTNIVGEVRKAYNSEKAARKSYYLSLLK